MTPGLTTSRITSSFALRIECAGLRLTVVTMPSGERVEGKVEQVDDFTVTLLLANGQRRTIHTFGTAARLELRDPLQPHKEMLPIYTDSDIHNVTAYLSSLRERR